MDDTKDVWRRRTFNTAENKTPYKVLWPLRKQTEQTQETDQSQRIPHLSSKEACVIWGHPEMKGNKRTLSTPPDDMNTQVWLYLDKWHPQQHRMQWMTAWCKIILAALYAGTLKGGALLQHDNQNGWLDEWGISLRVAVHSAIDG